MALALIDGSTAAFSFLSHTSNEWKCVSSYFSFDMGRRLEDRTTFCTTGGWGLGVPVMKQAAIRLDGFSSKGLPISDPLYLFASTAPVAFVATVDTGCTLTGTMHCTAHHTGLRAQGASEMGMSAVSDGAVTSVWVTT